MGTINAVNEFINEIVWGAPMLILLLATGAYFSARTGFFQIRHIGLWLRSTIFSFGGMKKSEDSNSVSPFQAMSSALAATLGTGNIVGVSTALAAGGAGAVFWMWISALFGMMTGYAENVLGTYYRKKGSDGRWYGGAMYYINGGLSEKRVLKYAAKPLSVIFAVLCVLSALGMGNMTQVNSAASAIGINFGVPEIITGIMLAVSAAAIIFGGVKRLAGFTEKAVPIMSLFYIIGAIWILAANIQRVPSMFGMIFEGAFGIDSVSGGISGYILKQAVSMGFRRGVFSNEAGLGTSVAAHAASEITEPCVQGMWSIFEVFFDTIVMCSLTAFIILASPSGAESLDYALNNISTSTIYCTLTDSDRIITSGSPSIDTDNPTGLMPCRTIYGNEFAIPVSYGKTTFSNIVTVTGIQSVSGRGEPLFMDNERKVPLVENVKIETVNGVGLATYAFSQTFGAAAGKILGIAVLLFSFTTVIGWSYFGSEAAVYIFGDKAAVPFKIIYIIFIVIGSVMSLDTVWGISDTLNGLMAIPNLFAVLCLSGKVIKLTKKFLANM